MTRRVHSLARLAAERMIAWARGGRNDSGLAHERWRKAARGLCAEEVRLFPGTDEWSRESIAHALELAYEAGRAEAKAGAR